MHTGLLLRHQQVPQGPLARQEAGPYLRQLLLTLRHLPAALPVLRLPLPQHILLLAGLCLWLGCQSQLALPRLHLLLLLLQQQLLPL
jgi:hypothetical protein